MALLQDVNRTATITCREDAELLTVDKELFGKLCPEIFERELDEKINFIRSVTHVYPVIFN